MRGTARDADRTLRTALVRDAMTTDIVTCAADLPLGEVADLMVTHGIHSVVVLGPAAGAPAGAEPGWGVISDLDLVAAAPWADQVVSVASVAASRRVVVRPDDTLAAAALSMAGNATSHVLVVEDGGGEPMGLLSALDVVRALTPPPASAPRPAGRRRGRRAPAPRAW